MGWTTEARRIAALALAACAMTAACKPDPVEDPPSEVAPTGTPLPQDSLIPIEIEIEIDGEPFWMLVEAPQLGVERFAWQWCWFNRFLNEDTKVCGPSSETVTNAVAVVPMDEEGAPLFSSGLPGFDEFQLCRVGLCVERNEVCAGYFLEERARSPLQEEYRAEEFDVLLEEGEFVFGLDEYLLGLSENELARIEFQTGLSLTTTRAVRFQPLAAPGRAALLRGALTRYFHSTRWGNAIQTVPVNGATCASWFVNEDVAGTRETMLNANEDGREPTWTDVFYETFLDGTSQYSACLPAAVQGMQDSAQTQVAGRAAAEDEIATLWNGEVDSSRAVARLLTYGDDDVNGTGLAPRIQTLQADDDCGGDHRAEELGPTGVPVCPPISNDDDVQVAINWFRDLQVAPNPADPVGGLVAGFEQFRVETGSPPGTLNASDALTQMGTTAEAADKAATYLCNEAKKFGTFFTEVEMGALGVPKYIGLQEPTFVIPGPALNAHFSGAVGTDNTAQVGSETYAASGAIRTLDAAKVTAKLMSDSALGGGVLDPNLFQALNTLIEGLEEDVGGRRIEFLLGLQTVTGGLVAVDRVDVLIHGIPHDNGTPTETYWLVQGTDALKCVINGTIDGAPCGRDDYIVRLNDVGTFTATTPMTDLTGGVLAANGLTTVLRPGSDGVSVPTPIAVDLPLYIIRVEAPGPKAFGGVIPTPGALVLGPPEPPDTTRHVIAPAGGTYEEVLHSTLNASNNDCSKVLDTCAGLPANFWPPLESEINGQPDDLPFEQSWAHYLTLARQAADEADALGVQLLDQGLQMDVRREMALSELTELCGVDASGQSACLGTGNGGAASAFENVFVGLGDKQACLWKFDDATCACPTSNCPPCPLPVPEDAGLSRQQDATAANVALCRTYIEQAGLPPGDAAQLDIIPVAHTLGLTATGSVPEANECAPFTTLREGTDPRVSGDDDVVAEKREQFIREHILKSFGEDWAAETAAAIRYIEGFADNYELTYADEPVFKTARDYRPSPNSVAIAPCVVRDEDTATGSAYWSTPVDCFVSGGSCPPVPGSGVGFDGCPNDWDGTQEALTLDTEPGALENRWAWGFGRLRRAVATLGIMTGQLGNMLRLRRVAYATGNVTTGFPPNEVTEPFNSNLQGRPCRRPLTGVNEPPWSRNCAPWGREYHRDYTRCVSLVAGVGGDRGANGDDWREAAGRPVNYNGFIPNALPVAAFNANYIDGRNEGEGTFPGFPILCGAGGCASGGVNPQMVYCTMPSPAEITAAQGSPNPFQLFSQGQTKWPTVSGDVSSGYIGSAHANEARFAAYKGDWLTAVSDMWRSPPDGFCTAETSPNGTPLGIEHAVPRAFCQALGSADPPTSDTDYMHFGTLPVPGHEFASRAEVGAWVSPVPAEGGWASQFLFDLRAGNAVSQNVPFQYPLTARNIFDALELACHARSRAGISLAVDCGTINLASLPTDNLDSMASILECFADRTNDVIGRYVVPDLPVALVEAFESNSPIASTTGLGGEYLAHLSIIYASLNRVVQAYRQIHDAQQDLAIATRTLAQIDREENAIDSSIVAQQLATTFQAVAEAAQALSGQDFFKNLASGGLSGTAAAAAVAARLAAAQQNIESLKKRRVANESAAEQKRLDQIRLMAQNIRTARNAADEVVLALNDLNTAASGLNVTRKQAQRALSRLDFSDFAGNDKNDPQYVNIAMRRIYNTTLIRYEQALERAKKLSFIARRAIELRFGVDLQRMGAPLTLVEAPSQWANSICTLTGIDYAKIREPNPQGEVNKYELGQPPPPGDEFASSFVGDYVTKLEDFVTSYPIDFPLQDGDDVAVISLADDVFRATQACAKPSRNHLYFATEFEKRDSVFELPDTRGWLIDGCGIPAPVMVPEVPDTGTENLEWSGCIRRSPALESDLPNPDQLPPGAVAYRLGNGACVPDPGAGPDDAAICPSVPEFTAVGSLVQRVRDLTTGTYAATLYVHEDLGAAAYSGNAARLSVVRESDAAVLDTVDFVPTAQWDRVEVRFSAEPAETYRFEISPSTVAVVLDPALGPPTWPGLLVAAAQVERLQGMTDGTFVPADAWQRTTGELTTVDPSCRELSGPAMRDRFTYQCEYICSDGISTDCGAVDSDARPVGCFYEANFNVALDDIEDGSLVPSGQIALGNFNFRHNRVGVNLIGTRVTTCDQATGSSCFGNGFVEYSLIHSGSTRIRNYTGETLAASMDRGFLEHAKALATERTITNPPSSADMSLLDQYMKKEFQGRPLQGLYTIRIWDRPELRFEQIDDVQLVLNYHYWTRFEK